MMYKLVHNNMVVDLLPEEVCYVRYLSKQKRTVVTDSQSANGVMGSDKNTIYHLQGTKNTFPDEKISVRVVKISFEEYEVLANKFSIQEKENANLRDRLTHVEDQLATTNSLLEKLLEKLS